MKRSALPLRSAPMPRGSGFRSPSSPGTATITPSARRTLRPVSVKRAAENRQRRKMTTEVFGDQTQCTAPGCPKWADDLHEPLTRARGGSITDPANARPLCREHHDQVTFAPESELGWAYDCGLLIHSWDAWPA